MDDNWNIRLKNSRKKRNLSLREVSERISPYLSQQSLVKYERGEVEPKLRTLESLCRLYEVPLEYIVYGDVQAGRIADASGHLMTLFGLLYSQKVRLDTESGSLVICDSKLMRHLKALNTFIAEKQLSSLDELLSVATAIRKMSEEK